jgi:hypothetical protein
VIRWTQMYSIQIAVTEERRFGWRRRGPWWAAKLVVPYECLVRSTAVCTVQSQSFIVRSYVSESSLNYFSHGTHLLYINLLIILIMLLTLLITGHCNLFLLHSCVSFGGRVSARLGPLGTTNWPIVPAPGDDDDEFEAVGGVIGRGNASTPTKPAPVLLFPATNSTWPALGSNQGRRCGKPDLWRCPYSYAFVLPSSINVYANYSYFFFFFFFPLLALRSTKPLTEMSTRNLPRVERVAGA